MYLPFEIVYNLLDNHLGGGAILAIFEPCTGKICDRMKENRIIYDITAA